MKRNLSSSAGRGLAMGQMLLCALLGLVCLRRRKGA